MSRPRRCIFLQFLTFASARMSGLRRIPCPNQPKLFQPDFIPLPHLTVRDADQALEFYKNALSAEVLNVAHMPDGKVMHAALRIGDSMLMLNEEMLEYGGLSPLSVGAAPV